jgi:two-component system sensor histidine kinase TctE
VDNAINYTPSGGIITARVLADADTPIGPVSPIGRAQCSVLLQVEDTGPGIPEAERELVFQPFYRALGTEADGSGLGLSIVQEIARQHSAEVTLEDAHPGAQAPDTPGTRVAVRFAVV